MKLVIDISDEDYIKLKDGRIAVSTMRTVLLNGTPLPKDHKWIPCSERLPQDGDKLIDDDVLVSCSDGLVRIGFCSGADLEGNREWSVAKEYSDVLAWMSLPEPYKGES